MGHRRSVTPTNTDLTRLIKEWREEDRKEYKRRHDVQDDRILRLASKDDVAAIQAIVDTMYRAMFDEEHQLKLATKADVKPVVDFYSNLVLSAKITSNGGKWISRFVLGLVAFFVAVGALTGMFKGFIAWLVAWAMPK